MGEFVLLDLERTIKNSVPAFWKGNKHGYTYKVDQAGVFQERTAKQIVKHDIKNETIAIPFDLIQEYLKEMKLNERT